MNEGCGREGRALSVSDEQKIRQIDVNKKWQIDEFCCEGRALWSVRNEQKFMKPMSLNFYSANGNGRGCKGK